MSLSQEELAAVLTGIERGYIPPFMNDLVYQTKYMGKVYSKGRPRFSGNGHALTPANTRKFEKAVKEHYKDSRPALISHGVHVLIKITDNTPRTMTKFSVLLAKIGLIHSKVGDVDNKAKTILDAANGVLLADDSQINSLHIYREYGTMESFELSMFRSGLSPAEFMNLETMAARK